MPKHLYPVSIAWTGNLGPGTTAYDAYSRDYLVRISGKQALEASSDPAFRGDATRHNPEELLVASLSGCHMLWYLDLCARQGVVVTGYVDQAVGTMETSTKGEGHFSEVVLRPLVTLGAGCDVELAKQLHEEAHRLCFIANSVNFPVRCEPAIEILPV
jgi:organic hydroperoxide reductase OsmC/OhrA